MPTRTSSTGERFIQHRTYRRDAIAESLREQRLEYRRYGYSIKEQHDNLRQFLAYVKPPQKPTRVNLQKELTAAQELLARTNPSEDRTTWGATTGELKDEIRVLTAALASLQTNPA